MTHTITIGDYRVSVRVFDGGSGTSEYFGAIVCESFLAADVEAATLRGQPIDIDDLPHDIAAKAEEAALEEERRAKDGE